MGLRAHTSSSMADNTGVVFSASITAQVEVTVGFSFTFGSFLEATVPRNPTSSPSIFEGGIFTGVRSNLTSRTPVTSRVYESENFNMTATPTKVTCCPAKSVGDLFF